MLIATRLADHRCNSSMAAAIRALSLATEPRSTTAASTWSGKEPLRADIQPNAESKLQVPPKMRSSHSFQYDRWLSVERGTELRRFQSKAAVNYFALSTGTWLSVS